MIDIHCHILAEVDDGAKSWDVAQEMCRIAVADGIEHIVATPHANERYHYDRHYLAGLVHYLRRQVGSAPKLSLGCDFHFSYDNLQDALDAPSRYTIEGSNYLLVELSNYSVPVQLDECFTRLRERGVTAVITHPERNPILQRTPERILQWVDLGCAVQVTASALTGAWGDGVRSSAKWLLEHDAVHVLASDAHDSVYRTPVLSAGRTVAAELCGQDIARALVDDNPLAIISGKPLPYFPEPVRKSSG
jgi:protein-tyrosine phosphatase